MSLASLKAMLVDAVKRYNAHEPLRVQVYSAASAIAGVLVAYDVLAPESSVAWAELATTLVTMAVAAEAARRKVTPTAKVEGKHRAE